jgi:hypothetical protein
MKRSIMMYVSILGLSHFLASAVLARDDTSLCYSTGPIENDIFPLGTGQGVFAEEVFVKVLNNSPSNDLTARILVSKLDGAKINIFDDSFSLTPQTSGFTIADITSRPGIGDIVQYEVQAELTGAARDKALLGAFPLTSSGTEQVAAQRLVHSEWIKISCSEFGPIP